MFEPEDEWMPLYLSCLAGASTCLGAAVVFFHPSDANNHRIVSANTMSFSLALAGSVMITVSVLSIGPECLISDDGVFVPLEEFFQRFVAFCIGGALYFVLGWFAFPEPEEVIEMELTTSKTVPAGNDEEALLNSTNEDLDDTDHSERKSQVKRDIKKTAAVRSRKKDELNGKRVAIDEEQEAAAETKQTSQWDSIMTQTSTVSRSRKKFEDYDEPPIEDTSVAAIAGNKPSSYTWAQWSSGVDLDSKDQKRAWRVAMLLFVSLLLHNFPEGLAVAASALESRKLGITVTIGIMIHNIPEGIAISVPCLAARPDSPWLGFALASLSGLAEPAGAFIALLCLRGVSREEDNSTFFNMENVLAFVAGIMIMVALYELFPEAKRHASQGNQHLVAGTICGIVIMMVTEFYV